MGKEAEREGECEPLNSSVVLLLETACQAGWSEIGKQMWEMNLVSIARKQLMKISFTAPIFMHVTAGSIVIKDGISDKTWNMSNL